MFADRGRTDQHAPDDGAAGRDRGLQAWITDVVHPHSPPVRAALDRAGLGARGVRTASDLDRLPVTALADLGDGRAHVLEPTAASLAATGPLADRVRFQVAEAFGRRPDVASRRVDAAYRPVVWTSAPAPGGRLFVASTSDDLDRLAGIGRRALAMSGVRRDDRVVVLGAPLADIAGWQLVAGCHDAGVPHLHAGDGDVGAVLAAAEPTVVGGDRAGLERVVTAGLPPTVRLLVELCDPSPDGAGELLGAGVPVARWWSPAGTRAAWVGCPGGTGFHTWPDTEVLDAHDGELVWSAIGWTGSVWLRVGTAIRGEVRDDRCPGCGRPGPRVEPRPRPPWVGLLEQSPEVVAWLGVRRTDGSLAVLVVPSAEAGEGWRTGLAGRIGLKVVPVGGDRLRRARSLAGPVDVVDETIVTDALRKAAPA